MKQTPYALAPTRPLICDLLDAELLPLARHARRVFESVVPAVESGNQQHVEILESRTLDLQRRRVQRDGLHQRELLDASARSNFRRRHAELLAERPRECLVRVVARIDGHAEDVARTVRQSLRRLRKSAAAHIAHHRQPGRGAECTQQVMPGHAGARCDVRQRNIQPEMALDVPERFFDRAHGSLYTCPARART